MSQIPPTTSGGANNRHQSTGRGGGGDRISGRGGRGGRGGRNNNKPKPKGSGFAGLIKDGCMKGIVITDSNNRPVQFKKLMEVLPTYCVEQKFPLLGDIIRKQEDLEKDSFFSNPPDPSRWSVTINDKVGTDAEDKPIMVERTIVVDQGMADRENEMYRATLGRELKKWDNLQDAKKSVLLIIRGQLDDSTMNELELMKGFQVAYEAGDIVKILEMLRAVCMGNDDGGLSYKPYKACIAVKSLNNFTIPKITDPFNYVEDLKTKFYASKALTGRFPNGTIYMETMLAQDNKTIEDWYKMDDTSKTAWETKGDKLNLAMLFLCGSKNDDMKKDLRVSFAQGHNTCYPTNIEEMARMYDVEYKNHRRHSNTDNNNNRRSNNHNNSNRNDEVDDEENGAMGAHVVENNGSPVDNDNSDAVGAHVVDNNAVDGSNGEIIINAANLLGAHPANDVAWDYTDVDEISLQGDGDDDDPEAIAGFHGIIVTSKEMMVTSKGMRQNFRIGRD